MYMENRKEDRVLKGRSQVFHTYSNECVQDDSVSDLLNFVDEFSHC